MNTCTCCGQALPSAPRQSVGVDDALLWLCNRAHEQAEARQSREVEIAHLVLCLIAAPFSDFYFSSEGVHRDALAAAAERWLEHSASTGEAGTLRTSAELHELLVRAEGVARQALREYASPHDLLMALVHHAADLRSAAFVFSAVDLRIASKAPPSSARSDSGSREEVASAAFADRRTERDTPDAGARRCSGTGGRQEPRAPSVRQHVFHRSATQLQLPLDRRSTAAHMPARSAVHVHDAHRHEAAGADPMRERVAQQERLLVELAAQIDELRREMEAGGRVASGPAVGPQDADVEFEALIESGSDEDTQGNLGARQSMRQRRSSWLRRRRVVVSGGEREAHSVPRQRQAEVSELASRRRAGENSRPRLRTVQGFAVSSEPDDRLSREAAPEDEASGGGDRLKRFYLSPDDDIVKAPSIGPRTAARLNPAGLVLVRDLLSCDPVEVAKKVGARYMTADRIADWKAQARLVCTIPWLRGTHAQLLVGAGYDTLAKLMRAEPSSVCGAILRFAGTREGQSILRSGPPPEIDRIACWIENTALAEPARAA